MPADSEFVKLDEPAAAAKGNPSDIAAAQPNAAPSAGEVSDDPSKCCLGVAFFFSCGLTECYKPKTVVGHGNVGAALCDSICAMPKIKCCCVECTGGWSCLAMSGTACCLGGFWNTWAALIHKCCAPREHINKDAFGCVGACLKLGQ